ncbi:MAG: mannose-1-phosphate guanylyltransferase/mannose-6-phosphate isomerase [Pseudomonadota bacterium]
MSMMHNIQPVILCGGTGTRLWPLSRKSYPKQFCTLTGTRSLFQQTIDRVRRLTHHKPIAVANEAYRFIVGEQMEDQAGGTILEPQARNTAPAICLAALYVADECAETIMLILPSDHAVKDDAAFEGAVTAAMGAADQGHIVTLGIQPTHPATGYGYISHESGEEGCKRIAQFVEKPSLERASEMLEEGGYLWNAGIFVAKASTLLEAFRVHAPEVWQACQQSIAAGSADADFVRPDADAFADVPAVSFDVAVMEKSGGMVVPVDMGWSDLGAWDAVWSNGDADEDGVVTDGSALSLDCSDSLLVNKSGNVRMVGIGLKDIVVVSTGDAVLIAHKSCADRVGDAVRELQKDEAPEATETAQCRRPWGWYESLRKGTRFQVKRIAVKPGGQLSLQSHVHRAEHWVVVSGTAKVTVGSEVRLLTENESVYVPLGEIHRLETPGKFELQLIEVQTGTYFGEDDIIRYEDIYDRTLSAAA